MFILLVAVDIGVFDKVKAVRVAAQLLWYGVVLGFGVSSSKLSPESLKMLRIRELFFIDGPAYKVKKT